VKTIKVPSRSPGRKGGHKYTSIHPERESQEGTVSETCREKRVNIPKKRLKKKNEKILEKKRRKCVRHAGEKRAQGVGGLAELGYRTSDNVLESKRR